MRELGQDLKFALRTIRNNPGFTAAVVVTLALGIGANTAIFSVVHAVLLQPIPYPAKNPGDVVVLAETPPQGGRMGVSYPTLVDWLEQVQSFEQMAGYRNYGYNLTGRNEPISARVLLTSASYFDIHGVQPLLGRFYTAAEDTAAASPVAVLNYGMWQTQFGARADVLGEKVILGEVPYTVIGVLPPNFELLPEDRFYLPLMHWAETNASKDRGDHQSIYVLARLKDGTSFDQARAEMDAIAERFQAEYPESNSGVGVEMEPLEEQRLREFRPILWILLGAVALVLLIACTNVANLLLARSSSRQREVAICSAIGASRTRLVRRALTESVVLAALGGVAGLAMAFAGLYWIRMATPFEVPRLAQATLNLPVLTYALGISLLTGLLFGLAPALAMSHARLNDYLKEGARNASSAPGRKHMGRLLLIGEVALATVLLISAGLLRTVVNLTRVEPGFRPDNLLVLQMGLTGDQYPEESRVPFYRALRERLEGLPGVRSAAVGLTVPMKGSYWTSIFTVADQPVPPRAELPSSAMTPVGVGYFETLGMTLVEGRLFNELDTKDTQAVIVVNETLAKGIWPNESPIGKQLKRGWPESVGPQHPWREIVGVVADTKQDGLDADARMETFIPLTQNPQSYVNIVLSTETDPLSLAAPVRDVVRSMDPDLPLSRVQSMEQIIASSLAPRRFTMWLLGIFASLAMILSAVGIYGVIAYSVAQRTRELGLRIALGAQRTQIFRLVVQQGMLYAVAGLLLGVGGAFAATRWLESLLFGVVPTDPQMFVSVPVVLAAVAFVATALPALKATGSDPSSALRAE
jgi:putative ABC transport system permease protein